MMKMFAMIILTVSMTSAADASMKFKRYEFVGDTGYANFCKAILTDDLRLLRRALIQNIPQVASSRQGVLDKALSPEGVHCNNMGLLEFARHNQAQIIHTYLSRVDKSELR